MINIEIKNQISTLEQDVNSLKGKVSLLNKQHEDSIIKQKDLQFLQTLNQKSTELLHFVKKVTQDKIKEMFENVVTEALNYIYQSNEYKFNLEFDKRGSLPTLKFNVKTPEMQENHNILSVSAGGNRDIIALALRFVLLEVSKIPGFLFLDEPFRRLDNEETINQTMKFIKELQTRIKRQIIIISHEQEVVDNADNSIVISKSVQKCIVSEIKKDKPKKKRRRLKKNVEKN